MRKLRHIGLSILSVLFGLFSQAAEITFSQPEYAGSSFSFYIVPNFITDKQEIIGDGTVDEQGNFSCELDLKEEMTVYSEFDIYKGWLVLSPDESLEIKLPPKAEKKSSNPYFRPRLFHFGLVGAPATNTNLLIDAFTRQYNMLMSKNMQQIFYRRSVETAETVIAELQDNFPETDITYFENFKKYKYANVKYTAQIQDPTPVIEEYFIEQAILYTQPEYSELFDKLFTKYLQYATQQVNGQKTSVMVNTGAYEQLIDWLTIDMIFDKPLAEAIIMKGIKPLFYSKRFNTVGLFTILQKLAEDSEIETHKVTANNIFNELARTNYGTIAPELNLVDINGNFVGWEDFEGKYVYLCFTRTDNEKFMSHKVLMKEFQIKYSEDLAIVVVLENDEIENNADLLSSEGFEWTVLRGMTRREIYDDYGVRILPTYFLIDPQGKMAGSQAPWPDENFEMQFANILKATKN